MGQLSSVASRSLPLLPTQWLFPWPSAESSGQISLPTHRPIAVIFFYKLPIVVVVESGVALDGLLLTQVLVIIFDAVHSSTGDLRVKSGSVSTGVSSLRAEAWTLCTQYSGPSHVLSVILLPHSRRSWNKASPAWSSLETDDFQGRWVRFGDSSWSALRLPFKITSTVSPLYL